MEGPMSGDIFPAREAIGLIDQVDLTLPLEIPPVPPEAEPDNVPAEEHLWLLAGIARLKKEKNVYILAHNYAPWDIQDVADAVGDSLFLAQKGAESDAEILLEASVLFMNQILAIMKSRTSACSLRISARSVRWRATPTSIRFAAGSRSVPTAS